MEIDELLAGLSDEEDSILTSATTLLNEPGTLEVCVKLDTFISALYDKISDIYRHAAPELAEIVPNKVEYVRVVAKLGPEPSPSTDLGDIVDKQTAMAIRLSPLKSAPHKVDSADCELVEKLVYKRQQILENTADTLRYKNLLAIVAPVTCAQLLAYTGGVESLASTPSANIPSLGATQRAPLSGSARQGILWSDPVFKGVDPRHMRSATRIVAGKLVLAARVDLSTPENDTNGLKWAAYIRERLDKLGAPPPNKLDKALPVPTEFKAKKRGGKRARKFKEKYHISELQKQSQRVEFGVESPKDRAGVVRGVRGEAPSQLQLSKALRDRIMKRG